MNIGILTQPLLTNYGGLLQNYALQQVLIGMGHKVETLDWDPDNISPLKVFLWSMKQFILSFFIKGIKKPNYHLNKFEKKVIAKNTDKFVNNYIHLSPVYVNSKVSFSFVDKECSYDAYVVGSDQVWRPSYNPFQTAMFLDFCKGREVRRIAYAASFGTSSWEYTPALAEQCSQLAKRFDLLTVREKSGVELCRKYFGVDATCVLDPTMLLNKEDYIQIIEAEKVPDSAGTLFYYLLDPSGEKRTFVDEVAAKLGLVPFTIMPKCQAENRTKSDVKNRIEDCVFPSVASWLRSFMDAQMTIVDSFHGVVFSIIFNKPFWVLANAKRGNARFESLLALFGLEDRMISTDSLRDSFDWNKSIAWGNVNKIRRVESDRCKSLLINALKQ